jgi:hypothetical protein
MSEQNASGKRDILIHFDEEKRELAFYSLEVASTARVRAQSFDGARISLEELASDGPDEAERRLGAAVLSLIDSFAQQKAGIRDYEAESQGISAQYIAHMETLAAGGDADAQFHLAIEYFRQARGGGDLDLLERADTMFQRALAAGLDKAVKTQETWPVMLAAARRGVRG